ncbi:MFS transporter [Pseudomonas sp. RIT-PI-S]|uniref:MFS transporter n=1 Tax=Pseudomonas sp. RIT-PI-S TaxID=3035295 RepID=UPI0021D84615|nr:MFS transporter [Pseudomonas sp. RIT-PI-S]
MKASPTVTTDPGQAVLLAAICLAACVLPLSFTGGAVATPLLGQALEATPMQLAWVTNAFMLSFGSLLMAAGALADRFGRQRLFLCGTGLFCLASLLIACSSSVVWIDCLRAVQGVAAAASLASGTAALAQAFDGAARTRAFGVLGTTFGVGLAVGPLAAGLLSEHWGWRAIFFANALIAGLSLVFAAGALQESRGCSERRLDVAGLVLFSLVLTAFTSALVLAPVRGWASPWVMTALAATAVCLPCFIVSQRRAAYPILPLGLFRYPRFVRVQLLPVGTCYCYIVLIVVLPIRLIGIEGATASQAGALMLSLSAPMLVVPLAAALLTRWVSPGLLCAAGFMLAAAGLFSLSRLNVQQSWPVVVALLVIGTGTALPWGLMDGLAVSLVPKAQAGMAAGIFNTSRVAGEGVALAITTALLAALLSHRLAHELNTAAPPTQALQITQFMVMGDLRHALEQAGAVPVHLLRTAYAQAFSTLLQLLAGFTTLTALVVAGLSHSSARP